MATDSLLSIDIAQIKADILAPLESGHEQPDSERSLHIGAQITAEGDIQPPLRDADPASVPELPSTVPDSQLIVTNAESQVQSLPPAFPSTKPIATTQKMTSQGSDAPTQELSPSHYEHLLTRSRSAGPLQDPEHDLQLDQDLDEETGATLHEGDDGHIDLISSLVSQKGEASDEEEHDSEPAEVDFSPTKSPRALSQFPESQRFKTPATAGRKRRYNGDVVDSPELPRNPLLRGGESRTHVMGLSQAFAATQANTSPFVGDASGNLHSDRPSPNIELQPRPMTAATSSPLRPLSEFKRASTEPASRYVSIEQSQALREQARRRQLEMLNEDEDSDHDSFDGADSFLDRERRRLQRDRKIQAQLSSISKQSMRSISLSKSSPIPGPTRTSPETAVPLERRTMQSDSSPIRRNRRISSNESEEETEQEDNASIAVTRSSQLMVPIDDEDKENFSDRASQIPETTARLHRIMSDIPTHVQDSPLLRHGQGSDNHTMALNSSQLFAVADSQPERSVKPHRITTQVPRSSTADEGIDFVPQSPTSSSPRAITTNRDDATSATPVHHTMALVDKHPSAEGDPTGTVADRIVMSSNSQIRQPPTSTVPETSSNEQQVQSGKESDHGPRTRDAQSHDEFDTAQTHKQASTVAIEQPAVTDLSSPPILTTPPGQRRRRLAEIAAEPSPLKSQVSFNASEALQLDVNFQSPKARIPSPRRIAGKASKDADMLAGRCSDGRQQRGLSSEPESNETSDTTKDQKDLGNPEPQPANIGSEARVQAVTPPTIYPRRERRPTAKVLGALGTRPRFTTSSARRSGWDLQDSPPQKAVPISKHSVGVKRKAKDNGPSEDIPGTLNKRLKSEKGPVPVVSLPHSIEHQQDSPDPIGLDEPPDLNATAEPEAQNDAEIGSGERKVAPDMVFACFHGKSRAYHPAICLGRSKADSSRFLIQWEGYDPDEVDGFGVRSLDLRIGDQVKIDMQGFPKVSHIIRGFEDKILQENVPTDRATVTDIRGYQTLLVVPKQRKSLLADVSAESVKKVPVSAIYLDSIMWGQMKDRIYEYNPSIQAVLSSGISTPLDRDSTPSTPSSRTRRGITATGSSSVQIDLTKGLFRKMTFAISYEDSNRKRCLVDLVQSNGGVVLQESFLDLFETDTVQLKGEFSGFLFAALLTDRHSRKEKYLQALALGIPCLSGKWIETCVKSDKIVDWARYLLPAGECTELEGATKSRILPLSASAESLRIKDIISLRPKIFTDSQVIVVMGKGKAEAKRRPYLSLIRALDPANLELEPDLPAVKARLRATLDKSETVNYVFVDDREVEAAKMVLLTSTSNKKDVQPEQGRKRGKRKYDRAQGQEDGDAKPEPRRADVKVKVMCNEDIVQSLILGDLWIGGEPQLNLLGSRVH